jgi:hypothetical protein
VRSATIACAAGAYSPSVSPAAAAIPMNEPAGETGVAAASGSTAAYAASVTDDNAMLATMTGFRPYRSAA